MKVNRSQRIRLVKRSLIAVLSFITLFVAVVGFAHTKRGRPLLALMRVKGKKGGCPLGYDVAASPDQNEAVRARFASTHRGTAEAAARPALGFRLDETTRDQVMAWGSAHGLTCSKPKSGVDLDCANVPAEMLPPPFDRVGARDVWFTFGQTGALIAVVGIRREATPEPISAAYAAVTREVAAKAGPASVSYGDGSVAQLSSGLLQQASAEYKFRNYYAVTRAANMGDGYVMTEEYRSLPN